MNKENRFVVERLFETDAPEIESLLKEVWPQAKEYPEQWRQTRTINREQIAVEMKCGFSYFGIKIDGKLVGFYKIFNLANVCTGEHQSVKPTHRSEGLGKAMYQHFAEFAKRVEARRIYVNILPSHAASVKLVKAFGFKKIAEYEQIDGMPVHLYEKEVGNRNDSK